MLDTHIFLWYIQGSRRLSKAALSHIKRAAGVYVSSASIWEVAIQVGLNKMNVKMGPIVEAIAGSDFLELPVLAYHAAFVAKLPDIHRDPFDRILIAQAMTEPLTFLTADTVLKQYSELVELVD